MNKPATSRVAELWDHLETHYAPTLTPADDATLRSLDDLEIDGKLTDSHFKRTKARLLDRPRSYAVDHATGKVDPAYWSAKDGTGRTNLSRRKVIHGEKHITKVGRLYRVTLGVRGDRIVKDFTAKNQAYLWRDNQIELRKSISALNKGSLNEAQRHTRESLILEKYRTMADARKDRIREALATPCPETGKLPTAAMVMRRPEIDQTTEPQRIDPR